MMTIFQWEIQLKPRFSVVTHLTFFYRLEKKKKKPHNERMFFMCQILEKKNLISVFLLSHHGFSVISDSNKMILSRNTEIHCK